MSAVDTIRTLLEAHERNDTGGLTTATLEALSPDIARWALRLAEASDLVLAWTRENYVRGHQLVALFDALQAPLKET